MTLYPADVEELCETISFLQSIIKANKLHEPHCVAFSTDKTASGPFAFLATASDKYCHCWLDKDNRAPQGEGFGIYHIKDEELSQHYFYKNNYYAVEDLLNSHPELSKDPSADNYWRKTYYVVPVNISSVESTE